VRRFSRWLEEEGEIERDQLVGVAPPKLDQKVYEPLTDAQVRALVAACSGSTSSATAATRRWFASWSRPAAGPAKSP
jgi:site-specific recombinase XerD